MKRNAESQAQPGRKLYSVVESEHAAVEADYKYTYLCPRTFILHKC